MAQISGHLPWKRASSVTSSTAGFRDLDTKTEKIRPSDSHSTIKASKHNSLTPTVSDAEDESTIHASPSKERA